MTYSITLAKEKKSLRINLWIYEENKKNSKKKRNNFLAKKINLKNKTQTKGKI